MSYFDRVFTQELRNILGYKVTDAEFSVRPHWEDGTPAHTKMIFNRCHTYYLEKNQIPVITCRKLNFEACVDEILWIYKKHSNNIGDLRSHIWDSWADSCGSIGKSYGYQIAQRYRHHRWFKGDNLSDYPSASVFANGETPDDWPVSTADEGDWVWMNQIDGVIWTLRNDPMNRGILTNMYNHQDLADMRLRPCAYSCTFNVEPMKNGKKRLNMLVNQRSQDMITANGWNVTQYSVLLQMIAQVCDMEPGILTHMVSNMHIYDRHEDIAWELIRRYEEHETFDTPVFHINPDIHSFKDFTSEDVWLEGYQWNEAPLPKIEVAI